MIDHGQRSEIAQPWPTRSEPGTYMPPEMATGAKAEPLPVEVIVRFRDALKHAVNDCDFIFPANHPDVRSPQITGGGLAGCDAPPDSHRVQLALEYEQGGRWVVASVKTDNAVPPTFKSGGRRYEVSTACYAGTWRLAVAIRGTIQGHQFRFEDHSGSVEVPAST